MELHYVGIKSLDPDLKIGIGAQSDADAGTDGV
jgi:hypothetical protein